MKIVEYERSLQWVGHLVCPSCQHQNVGWRSSGMSEAFPHFYCSRCSNVFRRQSDQHLVYYEATPELLTQIAATLPARGALHAHGRPQVRPVPRRNSASK